MKVSAAIIACCSIAGLLVLQEVRGQSGAGRLPGSRPSAGKPSTDKPTRQELDGARHRLENFLKKVELARGQPMKLDNDAHEALNRIKALKERFPDDPQVEELFEQARKALVGSKGDMVEVGPEVLAYRQNEQRLKKLFAEYADKEWADMSAKAKADANFIATPWPQAVTDEVDIDAMVGRRVILEGVAYPANQFVDLEQNYIHVGSPSKGYYYVELHGRAWAGAYEAFRRYKRQINRDIPADAGWTVLGRVTGVRLLVPQAGKEKDRQAQWGWTVEPEAIYVAGCTLAVSDPKAELGGYFSGQDQVEKVKGAMYSVTEIPADVAPERLVEIFSLAIKEKNYKLYLDCITPERRATPTAIGLCAYHWDWHQYRFATFYALVKIDKPVVRVIKGVDDSDSVETFFLNEQERQKIKAHSGQLVEEASVVSKVYDEKGKQYGSPKTFVLRRTDKGRWYIVNFAQPF